MFLLKTIFWLSVVIVLIPSGKEAGRLERDGISAVETLSAVQDVWNDVSGFCDRNEQACETGGRLASAFGEKARNGAKMLYVYLDRNFGRNGSEDFASRSLTH